MISFVLLGLNSKEPAVHRIVNSDVNVEFQSSPFFSEQLTAFELWLQHGSKDKKPPEQLPIVLQVFLILSVSMRRLVFPVPDRQSRLNIMY